MILYDQLGCGLSNKPQDRAVWTIDHYLRELQEIISVLELEQVVILGQSWGGMLAMEYAVQRPAPLQGLVLSNSLASAETWNRESRRLVTDLPETMRKAVDEAERSGDTSSEAFQQATMEFYRRHVCRLEEWPECLQRSLSKLGEHPQVYRYMWGASEFYCDGVLRQWDIRSRLGEIDVPALLLSGEYDEATPAVQREILDGIVGAEWRMVRNASHMTHLERPREYAAAVDSFLKGLEDQNGGRCRSRPQ